MQKARDKMKAGVTNLKKAATKAVRHIPDKIAKNKALNVFEATAAVHRESQSAGKFKASDKQRELYNEQVAKVAALRGIQKEGDAYKPEHLEKELSPKEILNYSMCQYYRLEENKDTAQQEIQARLASVYTDENNQQEVIPQEITATNNSLHDLTLHTDEDFFKLNEDEQEEYLGKLKEISGAEYDRLIKERDQRNTKAAHIYKEKDDRATPHLGKETDFKSKRGDIIDFMMDEIIIASFDWTLNRFVNFGSYLLLGVPYNAVQSLKDAHQKRKANDYVDDQVESGPKIDENAPMDASDYYKDLENKNKLYQNLLSEDADRFYNMHRNMVGHLENYSSVQDPKNQDRQNAIDGMVRMNLIVNLYEIKYPNISQNLINTDPYSQICNNPEELKNQYSSLFKEGLIVEKDGKLVDKNGNLLTPEQIAKVALETDINKWLQATYEKRDASSEKDKSNIFSDNIPDGLKKLGLTSEILKTQFEKAQKQTLATLDMQREIQKIKSLSEIFANDYAQYLISEHTKDPKNPKLTTKDVEKFREQAKVLFWQNMKNLRNKDQKNAVSVDLLLTSAEQMKETSKNTPNKKTPNLVDSFIKDKQGFDSKKTAQTAMTEFSQDLTNDQYIETLRQNRDRCNGDINSLENSKEEIDERRKLIEATKKRAGFTSSGKQTQRSDNITSLQNEVNASGLKDAKVDFFKNPQTSR